MVHIPADPLAGTRSPEGTPQAAVPFPPHLPSPPGTDGEEFEPASANSSTRRSRWLKLAVLLVVAVLCIAFAGVVWALIF